ncbi:unnamed protein product [Urochloa decumbens]|uniref:Cytochrome P450 n=1 Tax=Urochloa decumbens TaxID=240449 RepID=A0ABC9DNC3_9POAL
MEDHYYLYLCLALASLLVAIANKRRRAAAHGLRLPPGPWQLPLIGSMHHLASKLPHRAMRDLARRYGPVMLLRIGEVPTVVLSSREAAREVMKTHDAAFASRPLSATVRVLSNGGRNILSAPYGEHWRQFRKIAITELLSARRVLSFRAVRVEEVGTMLRACAAAAAEAEAGGAGTVDMRELLTALVADYTSRAAVGDRCKDRDTFLHEVERGVELSAGFNMADLWPSSRLVGWLSGAVRRAQKSRDTVYGILDGIIKEHQEMMESGGSAGKAEDLVDVLLKIQRDGSLPIPLDMDVLKAVIFDILSAGSETSSTVLLWVMAELIRNPKAMRRATAEVRSTFAAHGAVTEHALGELRYMHLVIRETFRLHAPAPLLLPRECQETCRVLGYDVPPGANVLVNVWALARDERYWPGGDAEEFRPERFEDGGEAAGMDFKGADFEFLPFGAGRRICPGMSFGLIIVELALASLLFHFDWEAPGVADPTDLDMTEAFGVTVRLKDSLLLRPIIRVPVPGL